MKKILALLLFLPMLAWGQCNPFVSNQILTASALNAALSAACITSGTISGLSAPLPVLSGGTGVTTSTGTGSVVLSTSPVFTTPNLGTPSSATLTNATGLPISSGVSGLGTGVATALGTAVTGSGGAVLATSPTITTPTINGVTNGSSASSGQVGYAPSATQSSAQSMTTSTAMNIVSLSLPAGDYDVSGVGCIVTSGTTTNMTVGVSTTSATLGALGTYAGLSLAIAGNGGGSCFATPQVPIQLSTTTTVYLIGLGAFSTGSMTSTGKIIARVRR